MEVSLIGGVYSSRWDLALQFAAEQHDGQYRKGTRTPYIVHLMAVAFLLRSYGYPEEVQISGLLHDVIEDTPCTIEVLKERFGAEVARTVGWCTEAEKNRPWEERKSAMITALSTAPAAAKAVATADKSHNLRTILDVWELSGELVWERFSRGREAQLNYYQRVLKALENGFSDSILDELRCAVGMFEAKVNNG